MEPVYFVQISDTHIGPTPGYARHGHAALPCAQRLVDVINQLPHRPDFIIHTGDVVTDPHPDAYALAAATFAGLNEPIYYVTGNHDNAVDIRRWLPMGPHVSFTDDPDLLAYAFSLKGFRFVIVDAKGPVEIDPHGAVSPAMAQLLQREIDTPGPPLVVFVHFPALPLNSPWMDENMLIVDGDHFHQILRRAGPRLRAVFHGHVHQPMQTMRDGILYVSGASAFSQFMAWPGDKVTTYDQQHPPGFNFVHLLPDQTIVHQHTFPRP